MIHFLCGIKTRKILRDMPEMGRYLPNVFGIEQRSNVFNRQCKEINVCYDL